MPTLVRMRRVCLWVVGVFLGALASSAFTRLEPSSVDSPSLVMFALSLLIFGFVTVSVLTAMETVFPPRRSRRAMSPLRRR